MTQRLLAVFAHPDDESFGPSATLAVHSAAGVDVHIVTMTDGAAGAPAPGFPEGPELALIRHGELVAAAEALGATLHHLDYRDSGYIGDPRADDPAAFSNIDPAGPITELVRLIRAVRPQVVLSHDENGGYFHPDHIRTHEVVKAAFLAAGDAVKVPEAGPAHAPERLYSEVRSNRWIKVMTRGMRLVGRDPTRVGVNRDVDLTRVGVDPRTITTRIDVREGWAARQRSVACHRSQRGGTRLLERAPAALMARIAPTEAFRRELPPPWPGLREHALFDQ